MKYYEIYVEGGFHTQIKSLKVALKLKEKYEKEGWNVKLLEFNQSIAGPIGREI